ncbi:hypothetical protein, partial [Escherichia coli]|uniref:hypothetical protein n=1 Tax=Escherichia coli TaxID=562 RepID=UPI0039E0D64B
RTDLNKASKKPQRVANHSHHWIGTRTCNGTDAFLFMSQLQQCNPKVPFKRLWTPYCNCKGHKHAERSLLSFF